MRTGLLIAGFVLVAAGSLLASGPYFDPRASAYMFALIGASGAAVGATLIARSGMPGVGAAVALVSGVGLALKPIAKPSFALLDKGTVSAYPVGDMHHLAFMIGGAILVVTAVAIFRRRQPAPGTVAPVLRAPVKRHLIVNPTTTFDQLAGALERTGFRIKEPQTGEPLSAAWDAGTGIVRYTYEHEINLRKLEIDAPASDCPGIVNDIVNGNAYISTIEHQLTNYLDVAKPVNDLLLGIRGAEWIGRGEAHRFYLEKVGNLRAHWNPSVASEAGRVHAALLAEAAGQPIPFGPPALVPQASAAPQPDTRQAGGARLYPVLRDMAWPGRMQVVGRSLLTKFPANAHNIFVSYAYDTGSQLASVCEGDAATLELEAVANLEKRPVSWKATTMHPDGRIRVLTMEDEYAAEMILSPAAMVEASLLLETPFLLVAVIARGTIIVQSGASEDAIKLATFCEQQYKDAGSDRVSRYPVTIFNHVPSGFGQPTNMGESLEDASLRF